MPSIAYLCSGTACQAPTRDASQIREFLKTLFFRPRRRREPVDAGVPHFGLEDEIINPLGLISEHSFGADRREIGSRRRPMACFDWSLSDMIAP
jgi:hypothetical protein